MLSDPACSRSQFSFSPSSKEPQTALLQAVGANPVVVEEQRGSTCDVVAFLEKGASMQVIPGMRAYVVERRPTTLRSFELAAAEPDVDEARTVGIPAKEALPIARPAAEQCAASDSGDEVQIVGESPAPKRQRRASPAPVPAAARAAALTASTPPGGAAATLAVASSGASSVPSMAEAPFCLLRVR